MQAPRFRTLVPSLNMHMAAWARVAATPRVAALRCTFDFNRAVSDHVMRLRHLGGRLLGHASMGGQKSAPRMGTAYPVPI